MDVLLTEAMSSESNRRCWLPKRRRSLQVEHDRITNLFGGVLNEPERMPTYRYAFEHEQCINFEERESVEDCMIANACFVVCTSNGEHGTINHMAYGADPKLFAQDLHWRLGSNTFSVCVNGGNDRNPMDGDLATELEKVGFSIGECDIGGHFSRVSTLYADRVEIRRSAPLSDEGLEIVTLRFS